VLKDDETVYKAVNPIIDLTLSNGQLCFIAEVFLFGGDGGPKIIEIFTSDIVDEWTFLESFSCSRDEI